MGRSFVGATPDYITWAMGGNIVRPAVMSCWCYVTAGVAQSSIMHAYQVVGANYFEIYYGADSKFHARMQQGVNNADAAHTSTSATGLHHVIAGFDDTQGAGSDYSFIYVDGVQGNTAVSAGNITMGTLARMNLGAFKGGTAPLTGNIYEPAIWQNVNPASFEPMGAELISALYKGYPVIEVPDRGTLEFWARLINSENKDLINGASPTVTGAPGVVDHVRQLSRYRRVA